MSRLQTNAIRHLGSTVDNLTLDNAGRIALPNQPAFHAHRTAGHVMGSGTTVVLWDAIDLNNGGCYSASTGRFTAPVAGKYQFMANGMVTGNSSGDHQLIIRRNGVQYNISNPGAVAYAAPFAAIAVMSLAVGDYVDVTFYDSSTATGLYASGGVWNAFCGHLIG